MNDNATIILELTPREAAVIYDIILTLDWERGQYQKEIKEIYNALTSVNTLMTNYDPTIYRSVDNEPLDVNDVYMD